jgi:protein-S-isoprenylcysteine O-methyltransferase Ste14
VADRRQPGWPQVVALGGAIVVIVLAIAVVTEVLAPTRQLLQAAPVVIAVLIAGTAWMLWRVGRAARPQ